MRGRAPALGRAPFAALAAACLLLALPQAATAALEAGAARVDITPPNGGMTLGFVRPDIAVEGVHTRLTGRVLVLDDGDTEVALLSTDLAFPLDKESLVARVRDLGFSHETILYTGTHTHSGPTDLDDWQLEQLARAIREARARKAPAVAGWASRRVRGVNRNRSIEAHLANHDIEQFYGQGHPGDDPRGEPHTVDETLRLLRVEGTDGTPIAAWLNFPVHLTTSTPAVDLWDADIAAPATLHLEGAVGEPGFVALYNNGTLGDLMPSFDSFNPTATMDLNGRRIAVQARRAWRAAGRRLGRELEVDTRWTRDCYCGQEVEEGRRVDSAPIWGLSFFGGSEDGASIFHEPLATEGRRLPEAASHPVQGRKIPVSPGLVHERQPEVQVLRIGDRVLLAAPGEPSVEMGRRFQAAVEPHLPAGVEEAFVVSLSNDYMGYLTTPEEYQMQHYEGGHTVFGLYTSLLMRNAFGDLTRALAEGAPAPEPSRPGGLGGTDPGSPPAGGAEGELLSEPPERVERMTTFEVSWRGAENGVDRPLDRPFLTLERREGRRWRAVASDLELAFKWAERDGRYTARYDVAAFAPAGTHRLRISSHAYQLVTRPFEIEPSRGLRPLGITRRGRRLVLHAQNPPPDPARAILWRPTEPRGGRAVLRVGGRRVVARWSRRFDGWVAKVGRRVRRGTRVSIAAGGFVDRFRNRNGGRAVLRVGELERAEWPPSMGVGGGRTPGPFGEGQFPP